VLDDRLRTTAQQLHQAEEESALQARRVQLAQTTLAGNQQLAESGFVAEAQVRQEELMDAKARAQALECARLSLMQDQQSLRPNLAEQLLTQAGSKEALYLVNVSLDAQSFQAYGEALPLKAGLTVEADVLQERRKVWEWVLEPVLATRQRLKILQGGPKGDWLRGSLGNAWAGRFAGLYL